MTDTPTPEQALGEVTTALRALGRQFALVGGLAISVRSEVRFTRDVDVAVAVADDPDAEHLVRQLQDRGYFPVATVEHDLMRRLSTVRLMGSSGIKVDLLFASSGLEREITERATELDFPDIGAIPVARSEELLAMKVLSMTETRLQDELDARRLVQMTPELDLAAVRANLDLITARGYHRDQDLQAKLARVMRVV